MTSEQIEHMVRALARIHFRDNPNAERIFCTRAMVGRIHRAVTTAVHEASKKAFEEAVAECIEEAQMAHEINELASAE